MSCNGFLGKLPDGWQKIGTTTVMIAGKIEASVASAVRRGVWILWRFCHKFETLTQLSHLYIQNNNYTFFIWSFRRLNGMPLTQYQEEVSLIKLISLSKFYLYSPCEYLAFHKHRLSNKYFLSLNKIILFFLKYYCQKHAQKEEWRKVKSVLYAGVWNGNHVGMKPKQ